MNIHIGCDHAGYELKGILKAWLTDIGHVVTDHGCFTSESVDYPDFAHPTATAVESNTESFGILICGSANGVCITANKHQGIRAALCWKEEIALLARQHNNANIIGLPARFINTEEAKRMVEVFISTPFEGGRHANRVQKIACS